MARMTQAALTRFLKAFKAAGFTNPKAVIKTDGTVELTASDNSPSKSKNDWDDP